MTISDRFQFERLQQRIDDPQNKAVVVVIVNTDDTMETAAIGIDNATGMFEVFFSLASQLGDDVLKDLTPQQRNQVRIVVPSTEQARELGILKEFKRRER